MNDKQTFLPQEIIRKKRDGGALDAAEMAFLVQGLAAGRISDAQAAAFAMAVYFRDMSIDERLAMAHAMKNSGTVLDWSGDGLHGPVLDKHSTGGVGDKVSLPLAAIIAAAGGYVPMISGRGLGHTGGTLDKLDSIPGYQTAPALDTFRRTVKGAGCAIIGQTDDLVPADRRLYAIRDVTATTEPIALITPSILSKKFAAGLEALVMDIKTGNGAFVPQLDDSLDLAASIIAVANAGGLSCTALVSDMNSVLGFNAGNALEVREAVDYLTGARRAPRLHRVVMALCAEMLVLGGLADTHEAAQMMAQAALDSGTAAERFAAMVSALGGPADFVEKPHRYLAHAPVVRPCMAREPGVVTAMATRDLGLAIIRLGGGRLRADDRIDYSVGFENFAAIGEHVDSERPVCLIHGASEAAADAACEAVRACVQTAPTAPTAPGAATLVDRMDVDAALARLDAGQ